MEAVAGGGGLGSKILLNCDPLDTENGNVTGKNKTLENCTGGDLESVLG